MEGKNQKQHTVITPSGTSLKAYLFELFQFKPLLYALTYRNIRSKYAQTFLGVSWALLNPLLSLLILGFVFGKIAGMDTEGIDPFLFTGVGLSAWTYFSSVVTWAGRSIITAQDMVKKIYFPRLLLPLSTAFAGLMDLLIVFVLLIALLLINHYPPSPNLVFFPLYLLLALLAGAIAGVWVSALGIRYRDFHHAVPFLIRIGLYASPVAYSISSIDEKYQLFFQLNPLTGILEGFRWCFFGGTFPLTDTIISCTWVLILLLCGVFYFNHIEKTLADTI